MSLLYSIYENCQGKSSGTAIILQFLFLGRDDSQLYKAFCAFALSVKENE